MKKEVRQLVRNINRAIRMSWQIDRRDFIGYCFGITLQVSTNLLALYFGAKVLGSLFAYLSQGGSSQPVITYLLLSVAMTILDQIAWRCLSYFESKSYLAWHTKISPEFNGKVAGLDIERFEHSKFSKLINKVGEGHSWRPANYAYQILHFMHGMTKLVSTAVVLVAFAPWILPLLFMAVIPSLIVESRQAKIKWGIWDDKGDASRRFHRITSLMQSKNDVMEMRIFGLNSYLVDFTRRMLDDFNRAQQKAIQRHFMPAIGARLFEGLLVGGIELWLIKGVLSRQLAINQYSFYTGAVSQFNSSVGVVIHTLTTLYEHNLFMTDFFHFMETPPLIPQPENPIKLDKHTVPEIRFEGVSFHYPSSKQYVFRNLDLTITPGEKIALVGENGAGKSTLIKLLLRYYDVSAGHILIDGHDIKDIELDTLYRLVSVLFQDFSHYPFSVADNIWMGRVHQQKDTQAIERAAAHAGLDRMVADLPHGYDSILDNSFDEGVEPSGGQWQRVALARAFYRNASILILDEPTAAIDAKAEYEIFNNIFSQHEGKTAIIVSHRFSTVRKADRILVFDEGRIIESGTHSALMKKRGLYHEMFSKQAEGYK